MKNLIIILCTCAQLMAANAQTSTDTPWTLEKCISHALEHNITVRQQQNTVRQQQIQLDDNRGNHLPVVDASVGQNFSFGRGLTAQNTYENTNTSSTSFSIGASVPIFSGNKIVNSVKLAQLNLDASLADLDKAREDISMQVAKAYVQILYDMEVADVARRQIAIDSMQTARLQAMMRSGKASQRCHSRTHNWHRAGSRLQRPTIIADCRCSHSHSCLNFLRPKASAYNVQTWLQSLSLRLFRHCRMLYMPRPWA